MFMILFINWGDNMVQDMCDGGVGEILRRNFLWW